MFKTKNIWKLIYESDKSKCESGEGQRRQIGSNLNYKIY